MPNDTGQFTVGGVVLDRPFAISRLGHFGFSVDVPMSECLEFYSNVLGLRISDFRDLSEAVEDPAIFDGLSDTNGVFLAHGTEHHSFALFPREALERFVGAAEPDININQITWQVGSLKEVHDAALWFEDLGLTIARLGRDSPGSNWNAYPVNVEGHINEVFYGMEQIGWSGFSKPRTMSVEVDTLPSLPQSSESDEVISAINSGVDLNSGTRFVDPLPSEHEVEGIVMPRPFKITKVGPARMFVHDIGKMESFYVETMGLKVTERIYHSEHECVFLRANTEHHSIALYPIALRAELGLKRRCLSFGFQIASYSQLKAATEFLEQRSVKRVSLPKELFPGLGYSAMFEDPDGNLIQLYNYMEQVGWDGRPRPADQRTKLLNPWPDSLAAESDQDCGEVFLGPWC